MRIIPFLVGVTVFVIVRGGPLDADKPTPFRYTFRVEKVEFGNDALNEDEQNLPYDGYEDYYDDSDEYYDGDYSGGYDGDFGESFRNLEFCGETDTTVHIPDEGCVYVDDHGDIHLYDVLNYDNYDDAYLFITHELELEECEDEDEIENPCFILDLEGRSIHFMSVVTEEIAEEVSDLNEELFHDVRFCLESGEEPFPKQGCVLVDKDGNMHMIGVLTEDNIDIARKDVVEMGFELCDPEDTIIPEDGCVLFKGTSIHFLGYGFGDNIDEDDDDDDDDDDEGENGDEEYNEDEHEEESDEDEEVNDEDEEGNNEDENQEENNDEDYEESYEDYYEDEYDSYEYEDKKISNNLEDGSSYKKEGLPVKPLGKFDINKGPLHRPSNKRDAAKAALRQKLIHNNKSKQLKRRERNILEKLSHRKNMVHQNQRRPAKQDKASIKNKNKQKARLFAKKMQSLNKKSNLMKKLKK